MLCSKMSSFEEKGNDNSPNDRPKTKLEILCCKHNIPLTEDEQKQLTIKDKVAFCFTHNLQEYRDFCNIFGEGDGNSSEGCFVQNVYSDRLIGEPHYWFKKLSEDDIKLLEEDFPKRFNQKFYRGKSFYLEWLFDHKLYTQALDKIEQYGWTIISENVLCNLLEKTDNISQLHFNFGLLIRLLEKIDTKSVDYKEMKEKPFVSKDYYSRDESFYRGMATIKLAAKNLPLDMFFLLLERYNFTPLEI